MADSPRKPPTESDTPATVPRLPYETRKPTIGLMTQVLAVVWSIFVFVGLFLLLLAVLYIGYYRLVAGPRSRTTQLVLIGIALAVSVWQAVKSYQNNIRTIWRSSERDDQGASSDDRGDG